MTDYGKLAEFYRRYGQDTFGDDEPAYAAICRGIADRPEMLAVLAAHDRPAQQPNLILAAVHYLLLGGLDHELDQIYSGTSTGDAAEAFADLVLSHRDIIDELLRTRRTQTNEVGRCALLALFLNDATQRASGPIGWIDLGTSGGLNLQLDQIRIDYTNASSESIVSTGPADAGLVLTSEVRAGSPPIRAEHADIAWCTGVDRSPIDVNDLDEARWLQACLWPSNTERMDRLTAAISIAQEHPPTIIEADAVAGTVEALAAAPPDLPLVITTTWVWYYLTRSEQQQVAVLLRDEKRPIWWYSLEGAGVVTELSEDRDRHASSSTLGLVPLGSEHPAPAQVLGHSHPHGTWFTWDQ